MIAKIRLALFLAAALIPAVSEAATLRVWSHYSAEVYINGNFVGHSTPSTPLVVTDLREGEYEVRVAKDGYEDSVQIVQIREGAPNSFRFSLTKIKTTGVLIIDAQIDLSAHELDPGVQFLRFESVALQLSGVNPQGWGTCPDLVFWRDWRDGGSRLRTSQRAICITRVGTYTARICGRILSNYYPKPRKEMCEQVEVEVQGDIGAVVSLHWTTATLSILGVEPRHNCFVVPNTTDPSPGCRQ